MLPYLGFKSYRGINNKHGIDEWLAYINSAFLLIRKGITKQGLASYMHT